MQQKLKKRTNEKHGKITTTNIFGKCWSTRRDFGPLEL